MAGEGLPCVPGNQALLVGTLASVGVRVLDRYIPYCQRLSIIARVKHGLVED